MNIPETYNYLVRARRDLWAVLEDVPGEVLSWPLLVGSRLDCIKDVVFHIAAVEDFWIHEDILRDQPVLKTIPALRTSRPLSTCCFTCHLLEQCLVGMTNSWIVKLQPSPRQSAGLKAE